MQKQYKLLLHIGLHKTATTSFQHNICLPLHKKGKINFLGVDRNNRRTMHYPFGDILNEIKKKLTKDRLYQLKIATEQLLSKDKLNILSEENISDTLVKGIDLNNIFKQLQFVFSSCDIHCLLSLRLPVDFIFSLYLEMYRWVYHYQKENDTFIKFTQHLFNDPHNAKYIMFFYEQYLSIVSQYFSNKTVLLFEDLLHDRQTYFRILANLLGVEENYISTGFLQKAQHITKKTKTRHFNPPVVKSLDEWLSEKIVPYRLHFLRFFWNKFLFFHHIKWNTKVVPHYKPDENLTKRLSRLFTIKNLDSFAKKHHLDKKKLIKYGYVNEN